MNANIKRLLFFVVIALAFTLLVFNESRNQALLLYVGFVGGLLIMVINFQAMKKYWFLGIAYFILWWLIFNNMEFRAAVFTPIIIITGVVFLFAALPKITGVFDIA